MYECSLLSYWIDELNVVKLIHNKDSDNIGYIYYIYLFILLKKKLLLKRSDTDRIRHNIKFTHIFLCNLFSKESGMPSSGLLKCLDRDENSL